MEQTVATETAKPEWVVEAITARKQERRSAWDIREKKALEWKEKGNALFRNGQYREAASCYSTMCDVDFTKPIYFSNLSAAHLKLGEYETAIKSSTVALMLDPAHKKSRFRRMQARKALGFHRGALSDAQAILRLADLDDPTLPDVRDEVKALQSLVHQRPTDLRSFNNANDDLESDPEDDWPNENHSHQRTFIPELYFSDSEDIHHEGNNVPCRYYNRKQGCNKGKTCRFSHAPDDMSERDLMGKNVCIYYLLGRCRFADGKCNYSHEKSGLPTEGWWTTEAGRKKTSLSMKEKAKKVGKKVRSAKGRKKDNRKDTFTSLLALKSTGSSSLYDALFDEDEDESEDEMDAIARRAAGLFTKDEEYELMCQGVKPWDSDAADVLGVIYGDHEYDDYYY